MDAHARPNRQSPDHPIAQPSDSGADMPVVMDADRMGKSLARIAHEILERNAGPNGIDELAFVGIRTRGVPIAKRIAAVIHDINGHEIPAGALDITLYRDDLMRHAVAP